MRPIKFRMWDIEVNKMYSGVDIEEMRLRDLESPECVEFMQFTGLKDKHGKEIYEGDIVKYSCSKMLSVVEYHYDGFKLKATTPKGPRWYGFTVGDDDTCNQATMYEVIGNIYENEVMLKGQDNEM